MSRNVREFLEFVEFLNAHNAGFICLKQQVNTTSAYGKLLLTILVALAEFEREQTSERTSDATAARAERGLWNGGQLFGYDLDPDHKGYLLVNEQEAEVVVFAFETFLACGSLAGTVTDVNARGYRTKAFTSRNQVAHPAAPFQISGIQHMLKNWAYAGAKEINKMRHRAAHDVDAAGYRRVPAVWPAIVPQDLFDQVQVLMATHGQTRTNQAKEIRHAYLLNGGLRWCGSCGAAMEGRSGTGHLGKQYFYYACRNRACRVGS